MQDTPDSPPRTQRQLWMAVLARASLNELSALLATRAPLPSCTVLRGPEAGLVMTRGRISGSGGAFNLGEMSVTRCSVRSETGFVGHAYIAGRDGAVAERAACLDAALQDPSLHDALHDGVIVPLAKAQARRRAETAAQAGATQVQFFTMTTMRT